MLGGVLFELFEVHADGGTGRSRPTEAEDYSCGVAVGEFKVQDQTLLRRRGSVDRISVTIVEASAEVARE